MPSFCPVIDRWSAFFQALTYFFKINNENTRTMCEIWRQSGVFIVNFEQISQIVLVFPSLTLNK